MLYVHSLEISRLCAILSSSRNPWEEKKKSARPPFELSPDSCLHMPMEDSMKCFPSSANRMEILAAAVVAF